MPPAASLKVGEQLSPCSYYVSSKTSLITQIFNWWYKVAICMCHSNMLNSLHAVLAS